MSPPFNFLIFFATAFLSYGLTFFFIKLSHHFNFLDYPNELNRHRMPVPFLGGVPIFTSFWVVVISGMLFLYFSHNPIARMFETFSPEAALSIPRLVIIFVGAIVILLVGFLDDRFHWSPLQKFGGQVISAFILMQSTFTINAISSFGFWSYIITFGWILLIINAFNFIDSIDGHCAGIAFISSVIFYLVTQVTGQKLGRLLFIAFSGSLAGFLPHNLNRAKIFLGDNGSLFIGYTMAAFSLVCKYHTRQTVYASVFIPVIIFGVPIYDTISVISVRFFRRLPPWRGDRNHFAHRLVKMGISEKMALLFSYSIAFILGITALLMTQQKNMFGIILIGLIFLIIMGLVAFFEFYLMKKGKVVGK